MKIHSRQQNDIRILELEGDVDFHSSPALRQKLQELLKNPAQPILIDLKKVNYIDSSGLATFVETLQKVKRNNGKLALTHLADPVRSVFEIAKLDQVFHLTQSEQDALQILSPVV